MIASTLTAVSAVLELASLSVGQPSATGGCELLTIRAGVIGGVNLFGGVEILLGTTLGMTSC
jgi:ribose/xylose/arabinose/galactoside ABC-type transport system permease subunit